MDYITTQFIENLIKALVLTIIIELFALLLQKEKKPLVYLMCIIMNIITNISMNLLIQSIPIHNYDIVVIGLEIIVLIIEYFGYSLVIKSKKVAFNRALLCNLLSYLVGLLLIPFLY